MSKQSVNYLLGELERRGYLERRPDPDDLRSKRIELTDRGRALIPVIRGAVAELEEEWSGRLGRKRFDQLRRLLVDLNREIDATNRRA
jgi:DNA-binding MarR family transcriptional regulator